MLAGAGRGLDGALYGAGPTGVLPSSRGGPASLRPQHGHVRRAVDEPGPGRSRNSGRGAERAGTLGTGQVDSVVRVRSGPQQQVARTAVR